MSSQSDSSELLVFLRLCVTPGDGGGGDGSSGSEDSGNDGGVSTIPLPTTNVQTTYDVLRGLGIVGSSAVGEDEDEDECYPPGHGRTGSLSRRNKVRTQAQLLTSCPCVCGFNCTFVPLFDMNSYEPPRDSLGALQMGDRVGPVGTGETSSSVGASGGTQRLSPVNWSMVLDRQEALVGPKA